MDVIRLESRIASVNALQVEGRVALEFLAVSGDVVFHGTDEPHLTTLKPQRPFLFDPASRRMIRSGTRAVYATRSVDLAIFFALTRLRDVRERLNQYVWGFHVTESGIRLSASVHVIDQASDPNRFAWVYVLDDAAFSTRDAVVLTAQHDVVPLLAIRVSGLDFPRGVIIEPADLRAAA